MRCYARSSLSSTLMATMSLQQALILQHSVRRQGHTEAAALLLECLWWIQKTRRIAPR